VSRADEIKARFAALPPEEQRRRLNNLLRAIDDDDEDDAKSDAEIRAELEADGVDVDASVARVRAAVDLALAKLKATP
jgi:hypothetical protein